MGPGNTVLVHVHHQSGVTVCSGVGQRNASAEAVARQAADRAINFLRAKVPVEQHLADQLLVPLALAGGGVFLTEKPTAHARTCMDLLPLFMDITARTMQCSAKTWTIELKK